MSLNRMVPMVAAVAMLLSFAPASASAQLVRFGVGAGPSIPTGSFGDLFQTGVHAQAMLGLRIPLVPVAVRADVGYHRFTSPTPGVSDLNQIAGTVNGFLTVVPLPVVSAYLTGGAGVYHLSSGGTNTEFGVNGGAGVRANLWLIEPFAEIRYHHVLGDGGAGRMMPITIGVMF
jgi:hypothetical protein